MIGGGRGGGRGGGAVAMVLGGVAVVGGLVVIILTVLILGRTLIRLVLLAPRLTLRRHLDRIPSAPVVRVI